MGKLVKKIPVESIKSLSSLPRRDLVVALAWAPIVAMDVAVQVFLLAYTMAFQCFLYFLYVGLFLFCLMIGDYSKLEKTGIPQKRIVVKPRSKKEDLGHQDVR